MSDDKLGRRATSGGNDAKDAPATMPMGEKPDNTQCPLEELGAYSIIDDDINYCPFCGGGTESADAPGKATCSTCGNTFWVEV